MTVEASELPKKLFPFFLKFLAEQKWKWLALFVLPLAWSIQINAFPYFNKVLVDTVMNFKGDRAEILTELALPIFYIIAFWALLAINWRILDILHIYTWPKCSESIRTSMFEYVNKHSHRFFSNSFAGSVGNKISDMTASAWFLQDFLRYFFFPMIVGILISVFLLYQIYPFFAYIYFVWFVVHMLVSLSFASFCSKRMLIMTESRSVVIGKIIDIFSNISSVRSFSRKRFEKSYLSAYQDDLMDKGKKQLWSIFWAKLSLEIVTCFMLCFTIFFIVYSWQKGFVSTGEIVFIFHLTISTMQLIWHMGIELPTFYREFGTCKQALSIIKPSHEIVDKKDAKKLMVKNGEIEFSKVHFAYDGNKEIFSDKNLKIKPGQKVGLVGHSGGGKTTFANLLLRNYDINSGEISIDGQNIASVKQDSLRAQIALIPQDTSLFHRSIFDNIQYGRLSATKEEVVAASKKAHAHQFIQELKDGYETLVGERGIKLSGGQRQRIAIARAILKDAPIIILDEATSSLDSVTEKKIHESLQNLMVGKTVIVIAHRLSTLEDMDRIIMFENGKLVEDGTHEQLLKTKGKYKELWEIAYKKGGIIE